MAINLNLTCRLWPQGRLQKWEGYTYTNLMIAQSPPTECPWNISCFPQMKPEKYAVQLSKGEKLVLNLLKGNSPMDLNVLKINSNCLSLLLS